MPDMFDLFLRWWKQIAGLVILTLIVAAVVVYATPKQYVGMSTALPAPTYAADKAGVFSQNLQVLYPSLGTPDDLDMILGTSHLDTVYTAIARAFDLASYYGTGHDADAVQRAGSILKEKTKVNKSDYGELKVKVWDGDRNKAADLTNAVMEKLQEVHQDVQAANNAMMLQKIRDEYGKKQDEYRLLHDSVPVKPGEGEAQINAAKMTALLQQLQEYEKLSNEYQLMVNAKPQALVIIEKATPPLWADKPRPKETLIAAAVLGFFFATFLALILERRRLSRKS
jgi:LPS O-antigen subunit length determinant protein (WzzB/FepE family)